MDSSRKRKAAPATPSSTEGVATKKLKLLNSNHTPASQNKTQAVGQRLVDQLQRATDKTGRLIATEFLTLPDRDDFPDYYQLIKLPVAVETIADKVKRNVYPDISAVESDFKRLIQNAKEYNAPKSEVYEDAERIRKLVSNFMRSNNPAYELDPHYQAAPTPIPNGIATTNGHQERPSTTRSESRTIQRSSSRRISEATPSRRISLARNAQIVGVKKPIKAAEDEEEDEEQEQEEDEEEGGVEEGRGGVEEGRGGVEEGRGEEEEEEEGEGDDEDAEAVEDDDEDDDAGADADAEAVEDEEVVTVASAINFKGKTFQEAQEALIQELIEHKDAEGLEIYTPFVNLPSRKLEDYYKLIKHPVSLQSLLKRARGIQGRNLPTGVSDFKTWEQLEEEVSYVWRNAQKYNEDESEMYQLANDFKRHFEARFAEAKAQVDVPAAPKIKLGGPKPKVTLNLSHRSSLSPSVATDNEVATRPKAPTPSGINGVQSSSKPAAAASNGTPNPVTTAPVLERTPSAVNSGSPRASVKSEKPATQSPGLGAVTVNGIMPPPVIRPPSSSSPHPSSTFPIYAQYSASIPMPPTPKRPYPRSEALLPSVTIATHPQLKINKPFSVVIPPHPTLTHQSTTVTLPTTHYFVQIAPTISQQLSMGRPYKMFVTLNGTRLNQRDTVFHADVGRRSHVYEGSLASGVNRIEVEIAAAKQQANGETSSTGLDVEKVTVYANLMR